MPPTMAASPHPSNGSANRGKIMSATGKANPERLQSRLPNNNNTKTCKPRAQSNTNTSITTRKEPDQPTKKSKRSSPFRIKVGCVVALRYRPNGNHIRAVAQSGEIQNLSTIKSNYVEVWTDPLPGRDEGLALIGRRVRCCFPKSVLSCETKSAEGSNSNGSKKSTSRIVEGEIVSLVDYESQWQLQRKERRRRDGGEILAEILVDREVLSTMPFLQLTDKINDSTGASSVKNSKENQRQKFEEMIRGKNKVTVQVILADPSRITKSSDTTSKKAAGVLVARWVIRKRVSMPLIKAIESQAKNGSSTGEKPAKRRKTESKKGQQGAASIITRYVGDGNDSAAQQERNWRWLAGRYHDLQRRNDGTQSGGNSIFLDDVTTGFVGEVLKVSRNESSSSSLAIVSLRRLILPEYTKNGRMSHHDPNEMFDDYDSSMTNLKFEVEPKEGSSTSTSSNSQLIFQVPVEELVIVSRKVERKSDTFLSSACGGDSQDAQNHPVIIQSYSCRKEEFMPLVSGKKNVVVTDTKKNADKTTAAGHLVCDNCRRTISRAIPDQCLGESSSVGHNQNEKVASDKKQSETKRWCDQCSLPLQFVGDDDRDNRKDEIFGNESYKSSYSSFTKMSPIGFDLPNNLLEIPPLTEPSETPVSAVKKRVWKKKKKIKNGEEKKSPKKIKSSVSKNKAAGRKSPKLPPGSPPRQKKVNKVDQMSEEEEDYNVFQPTCCRTLAYDMDKKEFNGLPKQKLSRRVSLQGRSVQRRDAARSDGRQIDSSRIEKADGVTTSRAARANQRRMMKGVAAFGATSLGLDALAGREQQLRFDKSLIHAWGVFADEAITGGDMIVEYRGELIGNAVAEKREKEYEAAKIGSDYMFRIDTESVCDATKQGNVARFINACCNPNCYTQIITLNGVKRITIYAKRDIKAGEELSYDYKFPLEYDEAKRIKCYCGARGCRGYMNWDKKYDSKPLGATSPGKASVSKPS